MLYVLDEPSIGLHPRDNGRLLETLTRLRDMGNTVLVVEHDAETIERADYVIDLGPGAGRLGGELVAQGTPAAIAKTEASLTGQYLSGAVEIPVPAARPAGRPRQCPVCDALGGNGAELSCCLSKQVSADSCARVVSRIPGGRRAAAGGRRGQKEIDLMLNYLCAMIWRRAVLGRRGKKARGAAWRSERPGARRRPAFDCLWCGRHWETRGADDLEGWAALCPDCLGRAQDNPFLRMRLKTALSERAAASPASGRLP